MFSKFKKVLVSLALAASLALAPMNVSAADGTLTNENTGFETAVNYQYEDITYSITVPGSVDFKTSASTQNISMNVTDPLDGHKLKITPAFVAKTDVDASITFAEPGYVEITGQTTGSIDATLDYSKLNKDDYVNSAEIGKIQYTVETPLITS